MADPNDFKQGDSAWDLLRKILARLANLPSGGGGAGGEVTLTLSDIEIGAVELKNATTDDRVNVINANPAGAEFGVVTRNIPSGTQPISAATLPLPAGAATEATLALVKAKTDNLDVALSTRNLEATQLLVKAKTDNLDVALSTRAADRTTAAAPFSMELSDGVAFYTAAKTGQLPAALVGGRLDENVGAWLGSTAPTVGQKTMANSLPVAIASDQSVLPVSAASLPLPTGAATEATLALIKAKTDNLDVALSTRNLEATQLLIKAKTDNLDVALSTRASDRTTAAAPFSFNLSDGAAFYTAAKTGQFPAALVGGRLDANVGAWLGSTAPTVGSKTSANSIPVVIASDQAAVLISGAITNAGTFAVQDSQVIADNAAFTDGTSKLFMGGFIFDEVAGTALTENDAAAARVDSKRAVVGVIEDATVRGRRALVDAAGGLRVNSDFLTNLANANLGGGGNGGPSDNSISVILASDQPNVPILSSARTASSPTFFTVGIASGTVVAANGARAGLVLTNTSNNRISLGFGTAAVLDSGITLYPGDSYTMDGPVRLTTSVTAIASGASSNLAVQEFGL